MQTNVSVRAGGGELENADFARKLSMLLSQVNNLQTLVREDEDGDGTGVLTPDLPLLRQGLNTLEQLAGELLYDLQVASGGLILASLPVGLPLTEALSQLVEATAEMAGLSSRISFAGRERPLPEYHARLLYRIAQEMLARVQNHEGARRLRFSLEYRRSEIIMRIEDDGLPGNEEVVSNEESAIPPFLTSTQPVPPPGQIIHLLRHMVEELGGALSTTSTVEQGVQVQVRFPYNNASNPGEERRDQLPSPSQEAISSVAPGQTGRLKVLLVDDQTVARAGLRRLLESYADLEVVGEARDSLQAISEAAELLPQVVLVDAQLPEEGMLETLRQLRQLHSDIHILILSAQENEEQLYQVLRTGASGYLLKAIAPDELVQAIRTVARGEILIQPQIAARLLTRYGQQEQGRNALLQAESLTAREQEVLQLLARGLRNKEIAARLFVSERTVNFHLANIYAKLHVSGRTEALSKALERGLIKA